MKGKIKLIPLFIVALFVIFPLASMFGQDSDFVNGDFVGDILSSVEEFDQGSFSIEIVSLEAPKGSQNFYNQKALYKLQTEVKVKDKSMLGEGKYLTGLVIDEEGVFDLGNMFTSEDKSGGYTPMIYPDPEKNDKYQTYFGTTKGKQILIGVISDEIPYFGNIYNNFLLKSKRAKSRYIENLVSKLKDSDAQVFVLEYSY